MAVDANDDIKIEITRNVIGILANPDLAYELVGNALHDLDDPDEATDEMISGMENLLGKRFKAIVDDLTSQLPVNLDDELEAE